MIKIKVGLQLSLYNDLYNNYVYNDFGQSNKAYRCFWAKAGIPKLHGYASVIDYYYYVCGDTSKSNSYSEGTNGYDSFSDPYVDKLIECSGTYTSTRFCLSMFDQKQINPYVQGIIGNWRADKTYTYYGNRKESTIDTMAIDLRKAGIIKDFQPYWTMSKDSLKASATNTVWVWNTERTQLNRRGFEIETRDPLGRFNAGLYGYSQTLPVAVANNAQLKEIAFDSFEDYDYSQAVCAEACQPQRHMLVGQVKDMLVDTVAHTGKYSIRVKPYHSAAIIASVADSLANIAPYGLQIEAKMDSVQQMVVSPLKGMG